MARDHKTGVWYRPPRRYARCKKYIPKRYYGLYYWIYFQRYNPIMKCNIWRISPLQDLVDDNELTQLFDLETALSDPTQEEFKTIPTHLRFGGNRYAKR